MRHYKNHPIYGVAVSERGMLWHCRGIVYDPKHPAQEIKRLECRDVICMSREEAEEQALTLCRAWIDGLMNRGNDGRNLGPGKSPHGRLES